MPVIGMMDHVAKRGRMEDRKSYRAVADLYARMCDSTAGRILETFRRGARDPYQAVCDPKAKKELRRSCSDGRFECDLELAALGFVAVREATAYIQSGWPEL